MTEPGQADPRAQHLGLTVRDVEQSAGRYAGGVGFEQIRARASTGGERREVCLLRGAFPSGSAWSSTRGPAAGPSRRQNRPAAPGYSEPNYLNFLCPPPIRSGFGPEGAI